MGRRLDAVDDAVHPHVDELAAVVAVAVSGAQVIRHAPVVALKVLREGWVDRVSADAPADVASIAERQRNIAA